MSASKEKKLCCGDCACSRRGGLWLLPLAVAVIAVVVWPKKRGDEVAPGPGGAPAPNASAALVETKADLQFLKGRWLRPDGGYVIEVRQVDADGQLDARYFNPNPIRVVAAKATKEGAAVKLYLELNDVNYPGCKYNLTYLPEQRQLVGTYFQAALGQTYEVAFEREP
ncbi:MAG TPA: hypothetical protein VI136_17700 [Verrucomicrobiae bacterium]